MNNLKGYTEHSYPFLHRVRKSEAPDYFDVIDNPMDLGTMHKKLRRCEYLSKKEFQVKHYQRRDGGIKLSNFWSLG